MFYLGIFLRLQDSPRFFEFLILAAEKLEAVFEENDDAVKVLIVTPNDAETAELYIGHLTQ